MRHAATRAIVSITRAREVRCFREWSASAQELSHKRGTATRAVVSMTRAKEVRCFREWSATAQVLLYTRGTATRAFASMTRTKEVRCFREWAATAQELSHTRGTATRAIVSITRAREVRCFRQWSATAQELSHTRGTATRAIVSITRAREVRCFRQWAFSATDRAHATFLARRALVSMTRAEEVRCFRALATNAAARHDATYRLTASARRWVQPALSNALLRWMQSASRGLTKRRGLMRLMKNGLARAVTTWQEYAEDHRVASLVLRRALSFFSNDGVARALRTWRLASAKLPMLRRAAAALANRPIARALRAWFEWTTEREAAVARATKVLRHLASSQLIKAVNTWSGLSGWRSVVRRAVRGWQLQALATGLRSWRSAYYLALAESGRRQSNDFLLRTSLLRLHRQEENQAFRAWADMVAIRRDALTSLTSLMRRAQMRGERWAFHALLAHCERGLFLKRSVGRWRHADLSAALLAWFRLSASRTSFMRRLYAAAAAWWHRGIYRAFSALREHTLARSHALALGRRALSMLQSAAAGRAVRTWAYAAGRRTHILRFMSRIGRLAELRALNAWRALAAERRRLLHLLHYSADVLSGRGLSTAVFKWRAFLAELRIRYLLFQRMLYRQVSKALVQWRNSVLLRFAPQRASYSAGALMAAALALRRGFYMLRAYAEQSKEALAAWNARSITWRHQQQALGALLIWMPAKGALRQWRTFWLAELVYDAALHCAEAHSELVYVRMAFHRLQRTDRSMGWRGGQFTLVILARLSLALRTWQWHLKVDNWERAENSRILSYADMRWRNNALYEPLRWWRYKALVFVVSRESSEHMKSPNSYHHQQQQQQQRSGGGASRIVRFAPVAPGGVRAPSPSFSPAASPPEGRDSTGRRPPSMALPPTLLPSSAAAAERGHVYAAPQRAAHEYRQAPAELERHVSCTVQLPPEAEQYDLHHRPGGGGGAGYSNGGSYAGGSYSNGGGGGGYASSGYSNGGGGGHGGGGYAGGMGYGGYGAPPPSSPPTASPLTLDIRGDRYARPPPYGYYAAGAGSEHSMRERCGGVDHGVDP